MAEKITPEHNERALLQTRELLEQKIAELDQERIGREKKDEVRRIRREEFHRRLVERSQRKQAIVRAIEESEVTLAKLIYERKGD